MLAYTHPLPGHRGTARDHHRGHKSGTVGTGSFLDNPKITDKIKKITSPQPSPSMEDEWLKNLPIEFVHGGCNDKTSETTTCRRHWKADWL